MQVDRPRWGGGSRAVAAITHWVGPVLRSLYTDQQEKAGCRLVADISDCGLDVCSMARDNIAEFEPET